MTRKTFAHACVEAIGEEMERDPAVLVLGEDVGAFGGPMKSTDGLFARFGPDRVQDMPMSESAIVGAAIGAALEGKRPVVDLMFLEFLPLVMQQLLDAGAMHYYSGGAARVPFVLRAKYGVGPFHGHAYDFHSWAVHLPGVKVVAPSGPREAKGLLKAAIRDDDPVLFIEHMALYHSVREEVPSDLDPLPIGEAAIVREGRDVTIVASANMTRRSLTAAQALAEEGIEAEVVDLRTISPVDEGTVLASVRRTGRLVVASEAVLEGGSHDMIAALAAEKAFDALKGPVTRVAPPPVPVPFNRNLEKAYLPTTDEITGTCRRLVKGDQP
jgi:pyruvate dehydrogenase E1 component beta subunit